MRRRGTREARFSASVRSKTLFALFARLLTCRATAADGWHKELALNTPIFEAVGSALQELTGEDFGPCEGAGIAGVAETRKQWQA